MIHRMVRVLVVLVLALLLVSCQEMKRRRAEKEEGEHRMERERREAAQQVQAQYQLALPTGAWKVWIPGEALFGPEGYDLVQRGDRYVLNEQDALVFRSHAPQEFRVFPRDATRLWSDWCNARTIQLFVGGSRVDSTYVLEERVCVVGNAHASPR